MSEVASPARATYVLLARRGQYRGIVSANQVLLTSVVQSIAQKLIWAAAKETKQGPLFSDTADVHDVRDGIQGDNNLKQLVAAVKERSETKPAKAS